MSRPVQTPDGPADPADPEDPGDRGRAGRALTRRAARLAAASVGTGLAERLRRGAGPASALAGRGAEQVLPVPSPLVPLFPAGGLRRGAAFAVAGSTSLLATLIAPASAAGSWSAVVGLPAFGVLAAAEAGVAVDRLALVPAPGADLAGVLGALLDGVDLVVVGTPGALAPVEVRRLAARARQRGAVLVGVGSWPGAELRLTVSDGVWHGLGDGHGHLRARQVTVRAVGRGGAARPRRVRVWLPAVGGGVAATVDEARGGPAQEPAAKTAPAKAGVRAVPAKAAARAAPAKELVARAAAAKEPVARAAAVEGPAEPAAVSTVPSRPVGMAAVR